MDDPTSTKRMISYYLKNVQALFLKRCIIVGMKKSTAVLYVFLSLGINLFSQNLFIDVEIDSPANQLISKLSEMMADDYIENKNLMEEMIKLSEIVILYNAPFEDVGKKWFDEENQIKLMMDEYAWDLFAIGLTQDQVTSSVIIAEEKVRNYLSGAFFSSITVLSKYYDKISLD